MKQKILLTLFVCLHLSVINAQESTNSFAQKFLDSLAKKEQLLVGKQFPAFKTTVNKLPFSDKELVYKVTVINFWFASCKPCLSEFGALNELHKKLKNEKDFQFVSITYETPEIIEQIKAKYNLGFDIAFIPNYECQRLMNGFGYPVNVIVNREGRISYWKSGGKPNKEQSAQFVLDTLYSKIKQELNNQ